MYVSSTAPIPQNSMSPLPPGKAIRYAQRKARVQVSVANAMAVYSCSAPVSSFKGFGLNFQWQVQRADNLLNQLNINLTLPSAQAGATPSGTSGAPSVVPLNPVNTQPKDKPAVPPVATWDAPTWGDAATAYPGICTPGKSILDWMQSNPGWALGGLAAVLLAGGVIGTGAAKRRRRAA